MAGIYYKDKDGREVRLPGFVGPRGPRGPKGDGEALKAFASGEAVRMDDVSTVEHEMAVKVRSKNILPYPYYSSTSIITDFVGEININDDTSITFNGYSTKNFQYDVFKKDLHIEKDMILSGCPTGGSASTYCIQAVCIKEDGTFIYPTDTGNGAKIPKGYKVERIFCMIKQASGTVNLTFKPMLEQGTTATAYTPYIEDVSAVKVKKHGLNLWDEQWEIGNITNNGENMVATDTIRSKNFIPVKAGIKLYCHIPQLVRVVYYDVDKVRYANTYPNPGGTVTPTKDGYIRFAVGASIGTGNPAITEYGNNICISLYNSDATGRYEPYIEPTEHTVNADGTAAGVTSLSPTTTLMTDVEGAIIDVEYNRDINKAFDELKNAIIALGGNV